MINKYKKIIIIAIAIAIAVIVIAGIEFAGIQKFNFVNNSALDVEIKDPSFNLSRVNTSRLNNYMTKGGLFNYSITSSLINLKFNNSGQNGGLVLSTFISMYNSLNYSIKINFTGTPFNSSNILYGYFLSNTHNQELYGNVSYYCVIDSQYPNGTIITTNNSSPPQLNGDGGSQFLGDGYPIFTNETVIIPSHEIINISVSYTSHLQRQNLALISASSTPKLTNENITI